MAGEATSDVRYAGFTDRAAAFVMDAIIVFTLFFYLLEGVAWAGNFIGPRIFSGTAVMFNDPAMPVIIGCAATGAVLLLVMCWLYSAGVTSSSYSGTFGKMIMGMKVTDYAGNRLSFWHATIRFLAKIMSGLILFIGFFMIHFSDKKQGLHDRFAGTFVVYAKKAAPAVGDAGPTIIKTLNENEEKKEVEERKKITWVVLLLAIFPLITILLAGVIALFVFGMAGNVSHTYVVAATVQQPDATTLVVTYQGGQDAAKLTWLEVTVNDKPAVIWDSPAVGESKVFHEGTAGKDHMIVTGRFTGGERQVVLDTYL
jgi:uncharacterized RDD family membrane protein YckC